MSFSSHASCLIAHASLPQSSVLSYTSSVYDTPVPKTRGDARIEALLRETEARLRRQNQVLVDLARRASIHSGHLADALREITEAAAQTLEVERVSVWFFN